MQVLLPIACILEDLCGIVCLTAFVRFIWMYPERSRKCTLITAGIVFTMSVSVSVLISMIIPDIIFDSTVNVLSAELSQEYTLYMFYKGIRGFISGLLILFTPLVLLRIKRIWRTLLIETALYFFINCLFTFISTILKLSVDKPEKFFEECVCNTVLYSAFAVLFYLSMKKEKEIPLHAVIDSMPRWLFITVIVFSLTTYFKTALFDGGVDNEIITSVYNVFWAVSTVGIIVSAGYFIYKIFAMTYQQNQILKQLNDQQVHYERVLQTDEQLREFRHDYKNHMMVVTALLNSGRTAEAADYLEKVKVASGVAGRQFSTGSFIADAILNDKNPLAEEFAIHIGFTGRIPPEGIENSDLCTVFANLLDNAIEGTKRYSGSRYINIESNVRNGMLALSIVNPVNEKVTIKNNRIKTSKSDSRNHGIGLRNVDRTAEKHNGHLLLSCDEKEFCADVSLRLNHPEEKEN